MRISGRAWSGVSAFLSLGILAGCGGNLSAKEQAATDLAANETGMRAAYGDDATRIGWWYTSGTDEMRRLKEEYAWLNSRRPERTLPPTTMLVVGRKNGTQWINLVMRSVGPGSFLPTCHDAVISVKFDDGPIQAVSCNDGSAAGIALDTSILSALRAAKVLIVEVKDEAQVNRQVTFDIAGLKL